MRKSAAKKRSAPVASPPATQAESDVDHYIHFGCITCKKTKVASEAVKVAEDTMLQAFGSAAALIEEMAAHQGITMDDTLRQKLMKWGVKNNLLPASAMPPQEPTVSESENSALQK